ncbi:O-antigen ligase family protein [Bosea sp. BK604]|uniref:O-antigen ligase family protein n=1 Tax=Bosea sp. BK604 TaxID=2512180 RepID=UPI001045BBCB|nr:O-antigen ligase family protein [Bosea sp. BK604]TCR61530.1 O-antigen ligase [Bosea sp. BK604]
MSARILAGRGAIVGTLAAGMFLFGVVIAALLHLKEPLAPLLLIGMAVAGTLGLLVLQRPFAAALIAWFLVLLPPGDLRIDESAYALASNAAIAAALGVAMVQAVGRPGSIRWNATCLLVLLYIVWGGVTMLWAPDLIEARRKLVSWTISFILLITIINQIKSINSLDDFMKMLRIMGWFLVACAVYTILFGEYHFGERLNVFGINENVFGLMLITTLPGVLWPVLRSSGPQRVVMMAVSIVFLLCVLLGTALSGSRGSSLAVLLLLLAFLFGKSTRIWGIVGLALLVFIAVAAPFLFETISHRFAEEQGGELGGRELLWQASLQLFRDYPATGVGIGNGPFALHAYLAALTTATNHRLDLPSHQPFLEVAIETGLFGLLVYIAILASAIMSFARYRAIWAASREMPTAYYAIVSGVCVAYALAWIKSGGLENHASFLAVLVLLLAPSLITTTEAREPIDVSRSGEPPSWKRSPSNVDHAIG